MNAKRLAYLVPILVCLCATRAGATLVMGSSSGFSRGKGHRRIRSHYTIRPTSTRRLGNRSPSHEIQGRSTNGPWDTRARK